MGLQEQQTKLGLKVDVVHSKFCEVPQPMLLGGLVIYFVHIS